MAESNATQVILTDDGIKIINAQNTANNAAGGVTNLNDPNLMSVIEKQTQATQYAGLTSQYNVILKRAKDADINTIALTTAYTNLNTFMTAILTDTTKASDVNRDTYKALTDAYNTALSKVQTALKDAYNTDISNMQSSVAVASQAASSAVIVASQAATTGDNASHVAAQASAAASQAKSAGDSATSVANTASKAASNAVIAGSTATVKADKAMSAANQAQIAGDNATSVANTASQSASDAILVGSQALVAGNAASDAYDKLKISNRNLALLSAPGYVDTHSNVDILLDNDALTLSDPVWASFDWKVTQAGRWRINQVQTNSKEIWSDIFVENNSSTDIVATSDRLSGHYSGLISWTPIQSGTTQVRLHVNQTTNVGTLTINNFVLSNSSKEVMWTPAETVLSNAVIGTAQIKDAAITSAKIGSLAVGTAQIASAAVGTAQIGDGAITNAKIGKLAVGTAQIANGAITNAQIGSAAVGTANIKDAAINSAKIANLAVGTAQIGDGAITNAKIGKLAVGTAQIANAAITDAQVGNVSATKLTAGTIDFNTITGKNINASNITTGKLSTERLDVDKLSAVSADLGDVTTGSLKGVDIVANSFSTPNGSFTTDSNGAVVAKNMTLIGGTLTSPTINTSTINGSTINGTTFHGGDIINNGNNTSGYYPMTITPDGTYKSTYFDSAVGLQSSVESGAISYKYRSMIGSGQYLAYDSVINGQGFESQSGYTSAKDTTFSNPETITGYVNVTPATGIYLYGPTQQINFAGRSDHIGSNGITMDAYGNIYAQSNSTWWRIVDFSGNQVADFGIDKAGSNPIQFNRELDVGNIGINTAHSIISKDGNGIFINSGKGGRADLNVASLNYTGSVSKSLLSEKRNVKKVDTSYWAQLVNSIDLATYQYKDDDNTSNLRLSGIVDDVNTNKQWQLPDVFVARDEDGKLAGIENIVLQNAMLATIQEQQKEIDQLNVHLLELEAKLNG